MNELVEFQLIDYNNGYVLPWFTHDALNEIRQWDLSNKRVAEFGGGRSTRWWREKCEYVVTVEANWTWAANIILENRGKHNGVCLHLDINEGDQSRKDEYVNSIDEYKPFDIVVVDGILRNECLQKGIEVLSEKGGYIIADNWQQDYVWISPAAEALMSPYEHTIHVQPDHTNHEGNPWKTAIFKIPAK